MKLKAFTLAEMLVVLVVIGFLAALSIPSLLKGIYQAQWRSGYKKAYNVVKNMYASEKFGGAVVSASNSEAMLTIFDALRSNIYVTNYVAPFTLDEIANGKGIDRSDLYNSVSYSVNGHKFEGDLDASNPLEATVWLISEDNFAYCVVKGQNCLRISDINASTSHETALKNSCVAVVVDVNGLQNSPNSIQEQTIGASEKTPFLTSERFYIYIASDGVAAGSKKYTLSGRLSADLN